MRIYFFSPFSSLRNYGAECNHYCQLIQDPEAWICISDQDVMFFTTTKTPQAKQIEGILGRHPEIDLFTVMTNRVANPNQVAPGTWGSNDILRHIGEAILRQAEFKTPDNEIELTERPISGLVMIFRKRTWEKFGGFIDGLLGMDSAFSTKILDAKGKIAIMKGVYVLHYYRMKEGGVEYTEHLEDSNEQ